jgi:hypothetical protein
MTVIDTNDNTAASLDALRTRGVTAIGRYYSSKSWKRITRAEALAISQDGFDVFTVFEDNGDPDLTVDAGVHDAQLAINQARAIGQPEGSVIYFALEHLPNGYSEGDINGVADYVTGLKQVLGGQYKVGVYSDGVVCAAMLDRNMCDYTWLSASRDFPGSQAFYESGRWAIAQNPDIDQNWNGLSVDVDETRADFGAFRVAQALSAQSSALAPQFAARAVSIATQEWEFFGKQSYDPSGHRDHAGHTEGEDGYWQRVGTYWLEGTNTHSVDGRNHDMPWSAAFISWVIRKAGAGDRFRYSTQHSVYIYQGIRDYLRKRAEAGFWTVRLSDEKPGVGDLVCWSRTDGIDYDHQHGGDYPGHTDIVIGVDVNQMAIIGGNVADSVCRRVLKLNDTGFLTPIEAGGEKLFGLMKCRIT